MGRYTTKKDENEEQPMEEQIIPLAIASMYDTISQD